MQFIKVANTDRRRYQHAGGLRNKKTTKVFKIFVVSHDNKDLTGF